MERPAFSRGTDPVLRSGMHPTKPLLALSLLFSFPALAGRNPPELPNKYARTEPFSVDYSKGRTYRTSYDKDPATSRAPLAEPALSDACYNSQPYDFDTKGLGAELSRTYLEDPRFAEFEVVSLISIPLQKIFVLDRRAYQRTGDGLVYAWKTSTGYHDKHYAYDRKAGRLVFGQKGSVQITHKDRASALAMIKEIGQKKGATYSENGGLPVVTFDPRAELDEQGNPKFPERRVRYSETTSKMKREKAEKSGLEIVGEDPNDPNLMIVKKYSLNYEDYYHTQPGYYVIQNGFSSRHLSGEGDGSYDVEQPTMPWAVFFNLERGMATHGAAYRGTMGSPNSHGCVRLLEENACRLFHLVGHVSKGPVSAVNEKTGQPMTRKIEAYRALTIVTERLGEVEKKYFNRFQ